MLSTLTASCRPLLPVPLSLMLLVVFPRGLLLLPSGCTAVAPAPTLAGPSLSLCIVCCLACLADTATSIVSSSSTARGAGRTWLLATMLLVTTPLVGTRRAAAVLAGPLVGPSLLLVVGVFIIAFDAVWSVGCCWGHYMDTCTCQRCCHQPATLQRPSCMGSPGWPPAGAAAPSELDCNLAWRLR